MWNRNKVLQSFQKALEEFEREMPGRRLRPRKIALRAHEIYCETLEPFQKRPAADTFRKFATGLIPCADVSGLLRSAHIRPVPPQRLDREKLRVSFSEAIQRMEASIVKGRARPLQIARRAYELYTRDTDSQKMRPSPRTFESLIYGKSADPEIAALIDTALSRTVKEAEPS